MINKQTAEQNNIKTIDSSNGLGDKKKQLIEKLKAILPSVINSDHQLDIKALQDIVDISDTTSNNQGYELTFAGKGIARAMADKPSELELQTELEQSKNFDSTDNVVIRGDNLEVLKILQANYHKKIKMIYIDPPYNTKSENFIYKDNFKQSDEQLIQDFGLDEEAKDFLHNVYGTKSHSGWLSFMYPRLKLARELLKDDGVIFISIDDNEQANLKILCDEIFGEENLISCFIWQTKQAARGVPTKTMLMDNHEYILCYSKNKNNFVFHGIDRDKNDFSNPDNDLRGLWRSESMSATGAQNKIFSIQDPKTKLEYKNNWAFSQSRIKEMIKNGLVIFPKLKGGLPRQKKFFDSYRNDKKAFVSNLGWFSTEKSTKYLMSMFKGIKTFDFPKPIEILKFITKQTLNKNDIILDFFAGSGTTADAVMQLNAEDDGNRKFILVQLDEPIKENTEAFKFCADNKFKPVISSITIERLNRAGDKIKDDLSKKQGRLFDEKPLPDIGYKVFSLTPKPKIDKDENGLFVVENERSNTENTLFNMLCATCKSLDSEILELKKDVLYQCENEIYLLENIAQDELEKYKDFQIHLDGWSDIDLEHWLNLDVGNKENVNVVY